MLSPLEKLIQSRNLILEVEEELYSEKNFCPYELGFALNKLDEAIAQLKTELS